MEYGIKLWTCYFIAIAFQDACKLQRLCSDEFYIVLLNVMKACTIKFIHKVYLHIVQSPRKK